MPLSDLFGSGKAKKKEENREEIMEDLLRESVHGQQLQQVPLEQIVPNRFQPRRVFDESKLNELARTIHIHGLIQPVILRKYEENKYEIIAGERRFRAIQLLEWKKIPAIVQEMNDTETATVALIENLQREELTSIEEAEAYQGLMRLNGLTQEALAQRMGKSQSFIANKLRLLKLSEPVQKGLLEKVISERHGRSLIALNEQSQQELLDVIVDKKLTVKETEQRVKKLLEQSPEQNKERKATRKSISKDFRLGLNTIKQSVDMVKDAGIHIATTEEDLGNSYRITIEISKEQKEESRKRNK